MALPGVKLELENGQIPNSVQTQDGIAAMILTGQSVDGGIQAGEARQLKSLIDAERIGISAEDNKFAHEQVKKFYKYAGTGATLWIILVDEKKSMAEVLDAKAGCVQALQAASKQTINLLAVSTAYDSSKASTPKKWKVGLDPDVDAAAEKAQSLCEYYAAHNQHFLVMLDGKGLIGDADGLKDYKQDNKNRVCVFVCNDNGTRNADVGTTLGRASGIPIQQNIGQVRGGNLYNDQMYFTDGKAIEDYTQEAIGAIHDKGYIACRMFCGKEGYYFTDDPMLTNDADDYKSIARVRVINKVMQLAFVTYIEELLSNVDVNDDGTLSAITNSIWTSQIQREIQQNMVSRGEIKDIVVYIDPAQNVLESDSIKVILKIIPVGCIRHIEVQMGFGTATAQASSAKGGKSKGGDNGGDNGSSAKGK